MTCLIFPTARLYICVNTLCSLWQKYMTVNKDLLIEIGTEELPPKALQRLSEDRKSTRLNSSHRGI